MSETIKGLLVWALLILVFVGCNKILYTEPTKPTNIKEEIQQEYNEEARQDFIEEQLF